MIVVQLPNVHLETMEKIRTKAANLRKLGIPADIAYQWGNSRRGYWRIASSSVLSCSITNEKLARTGRFEFSLTTGFQCVLGRGANSI